jgi:hypothetical protein
MSTICVLKTANVESSLHEQSRGRSGCRPISLLAFLQAENRRLQNTVAQLQRDTMALREALQNT